MRIQLIAAGMLAASFAAGAADLPPNTPVIKRGETVVTIDDMKTALDVKIPEDRQTEFRASPQRLQDFASNLFVTRSIAERARALGLDKDADVRKRFELQQESILADAYLKHFDKTLKVPNFEARARELYAADINRFKVPERVKFRYLMVDTAGRTREEARGRAQAARAKLLANELFSGVVLEYSNDPAARANRGEWGPIPYSQAPSQVADILQKLKPGEVSEVIESSEGFHIVVVQERYRASVIPFEDAKAGIIDAEELKFRNLAKDKMLGEITISRDITVFTDNIATLKTEVDSEKIRRQHEELAAKLERDRMR